MNSKVSLALIFFSTSFVQASMQDTILDTVKLGAVSGLSLISVPSLLGTYTPVDLLTKGSLSSVQEKILAGIIAGSFVALSFSAGRGAHQFANSLSTPKRESLAHGVKYLGLVLGAAGTGIYAGYKLETLPLITNSVDRVLPLENIGTIIPQ